MSIGQFLRAKTQVAEGETFSPDRRSARLISQFEGYGRGWFWETLPDGSLTYITDHVALTLARRHEELIGKPLSEIVYGDRAAATCSPDSERSLNFYLASRLPFKDLIVRADSAKEVWWSISGEPFFDPVGRFQGFSGIAVDLTEAKRSEIELNRLARYDSLTGLANRAMMKTALDDALIGARRRRCPCAVFLLDLDRFKAVNDTLGHPVGDDLLRFVASRLKDVLGPRAEAGRLGGDEFQVILPDFESRLDLSEIADRIIEELSRPYVIDGQNISIGVSVGISLSDQSATAAGLIRDADMALYAAKAEGRGCYRFFAPEMFAAAAERQALEADLRSALVLDQLSVLYQPSIDVRTERVCGFEALVRWTHPERGNVSPSVFIPLAEECGAIHMIGEWVLRTACAEAANWPGEPKVAVNLSPVQFSNSSLPALIANALGSAGLPAHRLELEITEGVLLGDDKNVTDMIHAIKSLGVRLALDDFGTGYSSLGYIQKVAFDKIKVDQSFVRGATKPGNKNSPIIKAVVGLASAFGMETTAEGVETQDELSLIRELGCTFIQGYIYGKPMCGSDAHKLLQRSGSAFAQGFLIARPKRRRLIRSGMLKLGPDTHSVRVRNISEGGALVEGTKVLAVGATVELDLSLSSAFEAEVRWVRDNSAGLQFTTPFDMRALEAFGAHGKSPNMLTPEYLSSHEHPSSPLAMQKERLTNANLKNVRRDQESGLKRSTT